MSLLVEIDLGSALPWSDQEDHTWVNVDDDHSWYDGAGYALASMDGYADVHYWEPYIISFTPPRYQLTSTYGGYCKMSFGSIEFSQDLFATTEYWPPPPSFEFKVYFTNSTEEVKHKLFDGTGHLSNLTREGATYDLYPTEYETNLLEEDYIYSEDAEADGYTDDDKDVIPMAFGEVVHVKPTRGPDDDLTRPTYYKSSITGTLAKEITLVTDNGSGNARVTTASTHGFSTGDSVTVEVDDFDHTYNDTHTITVIDSTHFDLPVSYVDDQNGHAYKTGYWRVYDDGIPIPGNVVDNGDGTFSLTATPVGTVSISGTGQYSTLSEVVQWACGIDKLNLTYSSTYARSPSPTLSHWASSQKVLISFLSDISAFWLHLFYISNDTLFLVDIDADHGERTLDETEYFPSSYSLDPPVSLLTAEYEETTRIEDTTGKHLETETIKRSAEGIYFYGDEESTETYSTDNSVIDAALTAMLRHREKIVMHLQMPLLGDMVNIGWGDTTDHTWGDVDGDHTWLSTETDTSPPLPGEKIYLPDTSMKQDLYVGVRCFGVQYDFGQGIVTVDARGSIALTKDDLS